MMKGNTCEHSTKFTSKSSSNILTFLLLLSSSDWRRWAKRLISTSWTRLAHMAGRDTLALILCSSRIPLARCSHMFGSAIASSRSILTWISRRPTTLARQKITWTTTLSYQWDRVQFASATGSISSSESTISTNARTFASNSTPSPTCSQAEWQISECRHAPFSSASAIQCQSARTIPENLDTKTLQWITSQLPFASTGLSST